MNFNLLNLLKNWKTLGVVGVIALVAILLPFIVRLCGGTMSTSVGLWIAGALVVAFGLWLLIMRLSKLVRGRWATKKVAGELAGQPMHGASGSSAAELKGRFTDAMGTLRGTLGRGFLYELPWYVLIGEPGSGKSTSIKKAVRLPLGGEQQGVGGTVDCDWFFTNDAVLLDTAGRFSVHDEGSPATKEWEKFLALLKKVRSGRPIDGVIVAIPADQLIARGDARDALVANADQKAQLLNAKLQELQRKLGTVFPVYVLITKCDKIQGFTEFFTGVPPAVQQSLFGWSNPHPIDSEFDTVWIDEIFASAAGDVERIRRDLFLRGETPQTNDLVYLFPEEFRSMKPVLARYLERIFERNRYIEAHRFRGVFFTSGGQDATPMSSLVDYGTTYAAGPEADAGEVDGTMVLTGGSFQKDLWGRPYFVHDFYNKKVFQESGLARPSRRAAGWSRKVHRYGRIAAIVLLVLGIAFLAPYFFRLPGVLDDVDQQLVTVKDHLQTHKDRPLAFDGHQKSDKGLLGQPVLRAYQLLDEHDGVLRGVLIPGLVRDVHETLDAILATGFASVVDRAATPPSSVAALADATDLGALDRQIRALHKQRAEFLSYRGGGQAAKIASFLRTEYYSGEPTAGSGEDGTWATLGTLAAFGPSWERSGALDGGREGSFAVRMPESVAYGVDVEIGVAIDARFRELVKGAWAPKDGWANYRDGPEDGIAGVVVAATKQSTLRKKFEPDPLVREQPVVTVQDVLAWAKAFTQLHGAIDSVNARKQDFDGKDPPAATPDEADYCDERKDLLCFLLEAPFKRQAFEAQLGALRDAYAASPVAWKAEGLQPGWRFESIDAILRGAFGDLRQTALDSLTAGEVRIVEGQLQGPAKDALAQRVNGLVAWQKELEFGDYASWNAKDYLAASGKTREQELQVLEDLLEVEVGADGPRLTGAFTQFKDLLSERRAAVAETRDACKKIDAILAEDARRWASVVSAPASRLSPPFDTIASRMQGARLALLAAHLGTSLLAEIPEGPSDSMLPALRLVLTPSSGEGKKKNEVRDRFVADLSRYDDGRFVELYLDQLREMGTTKARDDLAKATVTFRRQPRSPLDAFFFPAAGGFSDQKARSFWRDRSGNTVYQVLWGTDEVNPADLVGAWEEALNAYASAPQDLTAFEFLRDFDAPDALAANKTFQAFGSVLESYRPGSEGLSSPRSLTRGRIEKLLEKLTELKPPSSRDDRSHAAVLVEMGQRIDELEKVGKPEDGKGFLDPQYRRLAARVRAELELFLSHQLIEMSTSVVRDFVALRGAYPFVAGSDQDVDPVKLMALLESETFQIVCGDGEIEDSRLTFSGLVEICRDRLEPQRDPFWALLRDFSADMRRVAAFFAPGEKGATGAAVRSIPFGMRFRATPDGIDANHPLRTALYTFRIGLPGDQAIALCPASSAEKLFLDPSHDATWGIYTREENPISFAAGLRKTNLYTGLKFLSLDEGVDDSPKLRVRNTNNTPLVRACSQVSRSVHATRELEFRARSPWYLLRFLDHFDAGRDQNVEQRVDDPKHPPGHTLEFVVEVDKVDRTKERVEIYAVLAFRAEHAGEKLYRAPDFRSPRLRAIEVPETAGSHVWTVDSLEKAAEKLVEAQQNLVGAQGR